MQTFLTIDHHLTWKEYRRSGMLFYNILSNIYLFFVSFYMDIVPEKSPDFLDFADKGLERAFFYRKAHEAHSPASLPVPNSTHSFWLHAGGNPNPLAKEGSDTPIPTEADIVIIGSGISGVGAAYHISKTMPDKKVIILEARDFCEHAVMKYS